MDAECVSVLFASGKPRWHYVYEWGLGAQAGKDCAIMERPKACLHGNEACLEGEPWGRECFGAFEAWKGK